jgi:hypothetical protein
MAESHVISAPVDKRAELSGQIVRIEQQLGQFRADLIHIDAAIRLFAPDLAPETIQPKVIRRRDGWFEPGKSNGACSTYSAGRISQWPRLGWCGW